MKAELLAPAGSYDSFIAALKAGADAVYLGGSRFGARAFAENFDTETLIKVIDEAHLFGKKVYLTVNTLMKENELSSLYEFLVPFYYAGLDAVIVQDLGAVKMIKECFPDLPIHASTQMTITGHYGASFLRKYGLERVVPARELSLEEIKQIHESSDIEIECFVHGALCYCYSGQCFMSSFIGGRSGNRGKCAQPCRLPYTVTENGNKLTDKDSEYALNTKDICTIEILPEILKAGVYSLKIEGRMKRPEYTAGVVSIYRKYLDKILKGKKYKVDNNDLRFLFDLFNRDGFSRSYYEQHNGPAMMALKNIKSKEATRLVDDVYKKVNDEILNKELKITVLADCYVTESMAMITLTYGDCSAAAVTTEVSKAINRALDYTSFEKQIKKTGGTFFNIDVTSMTIDDGLFMTIKAINELRREALDNLREEILNKYRRLNKPIEYKEHDLDKKMCNDCSVSVQVSSKSQLDAAVNNKIVSCVYIPYRMICEYGDTELTMVENIINSDKKAFVELPLVSRKVDENYKEFLKEVNKLGAGLLVNSLEDLTLLKELGILNVRLNYGLYMMNSKAMEFKKEMGLIYDTIPLELNKGEISKRDNSLSELIVYGKVPLMVSAQCLKKNFDKCNKKYETLKITDRKNYSSLVKCDCSVCQNIIYNSLPISLISKKEEVYRTNCSSVRFIFTDEDAKTMNELLSLWQADDSNEQFDFTRGHFTRGVE